MDVYRPDSKDVAFEIELQAHPMYVDQWEKVYDWLGGLRRASTPKDYYLHRRLLNWFYAVQVFEDECRVREKEAASRLRLVVRLNQPPHVRKLLADEISGVRTSRLVGAAIRAVLRDLGDAMVWRLMGYRRPVIAAIGRGEVVGRLSDEGLASELDEIQWLWEQRGVFALHADLTTCVRHGDVLAFESLDPLRLYSTESKRSGRFNRSSKQGRRQAQLQELLRTGYHATAADGASLALVALGVSYATHHRTLQGAVEAAREETYTVTRLSREVALEVWDETNPAGFPRDDGRNRHAEMRADSGWDDDDEVIVASAALRRQRGRHLDHNFPSLAPLSLTPLRVKDVADLITGRLDFITTLHLPSLEERFHEAGIEVDLFRGKAAADRFLRATRGVAACSVPATVREQLQIELMTPETVVATVNRMLAATEAGEHPATNLALGFDGEDRVWESDQAPRGR